MLLFLLAICARSALGDFNGTSYRDPSLAWKSEPFDGQTASATTASATTDGVIVFHNIWFHNQRFYAITEDGLAGLHAQSSLGQHTELHKLPVKKGSAFFENLEAHWLGGTTLFIEFPLPAAPGSLGHWTEVVVPIFCALASTAWENAASGQPIRQLVFVNLERANLEAADWLWAMWEVALSPAHVPRKPHVLFWNDLDAPGRQHWLCLEHVLVAPNRHSSPAGPSAFWTAELGQRFREAAFALNDLSAPGELPRTITFMSGIAGEEVANQLELVEHLEDTAAAMDMRVRPYTVSTEAPFSSFLSAMARTGVLVARHGPLLANAIFLPPGALVVELLPYKWEWRGESALFRNLTRSLGDTHHVAWRATHARHALFAAPDDARFVDWADEDCTSADCLDTHAAAGMVADCAAVQELLHRMLPAVLAGAEPASIELPWPSADGGGAVGSCPSQPLA